MLKEGLDFNPGMKPLWAKERISAGCRSVWKPREEQSKNRY